MSKISLQCSNCGNRIEIENTVDDAVNVIKSGWDSIGYAMYCPDCVRQIKTGTQRNRLGGERNTFIVIMDWLLKAKG